MFRNTLLPWHRRFHGAIQIRRGRKPRPRQPDRRFAAGLQLRKECCR